MGIQGKFEVIRNIWVTSVGWTLHGQQGSRTTTSDLIAYRCSSVNTEGLDEGVVILVQNVLHSPCIWLQHIYNFWVLFTLVQILLLVICTATSWAQKQNRHGLPRVCAQQFLHQNFVQIWSEDLFCKQDGMAKNYFCLKEVIKSWHCSIWILYDAVDLKQNVTKWVLYKLCELAIFSPNCTPFPIHICCCF